MIANHQVTAPTARTRSVSSPTISQLERELSCRCFSSVRRSSISCPTFGFHFLPRRGPLGGAEYLSVDRQARKAAVGAGA